MYNVFANVACASNTCKSVTSSNWTIIKENQTFAMKQILISSRIVCNGQFFFMVVSRFFSFFILLFHF